ncbi:hypothetical protein AHF37_08363, partial [Paragonimus kellicotti]
TQFVRRPKRLHSGRFVENKKSLSFLHTFPTDQYRDRASCAVELSDFNKSLGSSGEFDNILRVHSSCLQLSVQHWGNGTSSQKYGTDAMLLCRFTKPMFQQKPSVAPAQVLVKTRQLQGDQKPDAHHVYSADRSIFLLGTFLFQASIGTNQIQYNYLQVFQQFGSENAVKWTAYLFSTPQCQYKQTEDGGTIVSVDHALAWMDLKAGRY